MLSIRKWQGGDGIITFCISRTRSYIARASGVNLPPLPTGIVRVTIYNPGVQGEQWTIGLLTVGCIAIPFAPSIDEKYLRMDQFRFTIGKSILILMVIWLDRSPSKFFVVAAIVKGGGSSRSCNYWKVGLMNRSRNIAI
jgi:hypothetical protein